MTNTFAAYLASDFSGPAAHVCEGRKDTRISRWKKVKKVKKVDA